MGDEKPTQLSRLHDIPVPMAVMSSLAGFLPHLPISYNIGEPNETNSGKLIVCDLGKGAGFPPQLE